MKKILFLSFLSASFLFAKYDPFLYGYETEAIKEKLKEKALEEERKRLEEEKKYEITVTTIEEVKPKVEPKVVVEKELEVDNDEELEQQFFEELNRIKTIKSNNKKVVVETENIDTLLDGIKFFDETDPSSFRYDNLDDNQISSNTKEQNFIVDISKNKKYVLLYEDKNSKNIKNKLLINSINNAYVLKSNKRNNIFGIIVDVDKYNINKIKILYKEYKDISYEEIINNYDLSKNYMN